MTILLKWNGGKYKGVENKAGGSRGEGGNPYTYTTTSWKTVITENKEYPYSNQAFFYAPFLFYRALCIPTGAIGHFVVVSTFSFCLESHVNETT